MGASSLLLQLSTASACTDKSILLAAIRTGLNGLALYLLFFLINISDSSRFMFEVQEEGGYRSGRFLTFSRLDRMQL